jgi:L-fucose dehydrogenase
VRTRMLLQTGPLGVTRTNTTMELAKDSSRVALITGAAQGIGAGCARLFARSGYRVVICDTDKAGATAVLDELGRPATPGSIFLECDVRNPHTVEQVVSLAATRLGRLDTVINNVGINYPGRTLEDLTLKQIDDLLRTNLLSCILVSRYALPHLRRTRGSIVNIGSIAGRVGHDLASVYCATKAGISAFGKALAIEEASAGVRVNTVLPGNVMTTARAKLEHQMASASEFHETVETWQWIGRSASVDEVAQVALFLASDGASFVTGAELAVTGGAELGFGPKRRTNFDTELRSRIRARSAGPGEG